MFPEVECLNVMQVLAQLREQFFSSEKNRLALNVCSRFSPIFSRKYDCYPISLSLWFDTCPLIVFKDNSANDHSWQYDHDHVFVRSDPLEACLQRSCLENTVHIYNHKVLLLRTMNERSDEIVDLEEQRTCWSENALKVEVEGKPVTNQKSSGRWEPSSCIFFDVLKIFTPLKKTSEIWTLSLLQVLVVCNAQCRKTAVCQTTQHWGLRVQPGYWNFYPTGQGPGSNHILIPGPSLLLG